MSPKKEYIPYLFLFIGVFVLFSLLSFNPSDEIGESNWFGRLGFFFAYGMFFLLGSASYLIGIGLVGMGGFLFKKPNLDIPSKLLQLPVLILSSSLALSFLTDNKEELGDSGGAIGQFTGDILDFAIGGSGKAILTAFLFAYASFGIINDESFLDTKKRIWAWIRSIITGIPIPKHPMSSTFSPGKENTTQSRLSTQQWKDFLIKKKNEFDSKKKEFENRFTSRLEESRIEPLEAHSRNYHKEEPLTLKYNSKRIYPRYKNASLYEGFFEDGEVFRFHSAPVSLKRKVSETPDSVSLGFAILDYRRESSYIERESISEQKEYRTKYEEEEIQQEYEEIPEMEIIPESTRNIVDPSVEIDDSQDDFEEIEEEDSTEEVEEVLEQEPRIHTLPLNTLRPKLKEESLLPNTYVPPVPLAKGGYYISPRLLGAPKEKPLSIESKADSDRVARKIEEIISHYGIESKVISMERGPIITRYELTIPNGIKLNKITSLDSELKLYLAVKSIRIVAPIPGKSSIGIEVPNRNREDVFLMDILRESTFAKSQGGLSICIGKDIAGRPVHIDLTKLPHLLVAGTTGSGKSVSLNSMVTSLIFTRSPQELRFIMIDPKMVEMTLYEEIPHLLMPVIVDPRKATKALSWAIQEMEARYQTISKLKCRDFSGYNMKVDEWAHKKGYEKMPYIVIVIDELSDLMMVSGKELEEQIQRISQKSRAVGIHLVMATQRPSVDVITGLIKANCPARIAFQVAQKTDSRTILDTNGAEALLGKGDFLYRSPTASDLVRIQAPFVSEEEIDKIVMESKKMASPGFVEINWDDDGGGDSSDSFEEDENLIEDAWRIICQEGKASGSMIQRHLRIGYNKAARIIDILEKRGIISPQIGTKPREILKSI